MQASDIMTRTVVSVVPDTTVSEVAATLIAHHISGVPVVDAENRIVGVISEGDLFIVDRNSAPNGRDDVGSSFLPRMPASHATMSTRTGPRPAT